MLIRACLFATASLGFAQLDSDTLTVTSTRTPSPISDEVNVTVYVSSGPNSTLDSVVAALQTTGLTAANFVNVYSYGIRTDWTFTLSGPYSKLKDTVAALTRVRNSSDMGVTYSVYPARSPSQAANTCAWPALLSDAQAEAQRLAAAAAVRVGPILALSDERAVPSDIVPTYAFRSGSFFTVVGVLGGISQIPITPLVFAPPIIPAPPCFLTVQFKLLR